LSTTFDVSTVTHAVASLSISGVTVKDIHDLTASIGLAYAILMPRPDDFITDVSIEPAELSKQNLDVRYTLHYQYFHCAVGNNLFGDYSPMMTNIAAIVKAFCNDATLTGSIDGGMPTIDGVTLLMDASGNKYHGAEFSLPILQFLEV
jgi:hypothetical protein